jgi:hypothetical protein
VINSSRLTEALALLADEFARARSRRLRGHRPAVRRPVLGFFAARAGIDQKIAALSARSAGAVAKLNARLGYNYSGHLVGVVNRSMTKSPAIVNTAISVGTKARS